MSGDLFDEFESKVFWSFTCAICLAKSCAVILTFSASYYATSAAIGWLS